MKKISAPVFALLTPFNVDGQIDFVALSDYIFFLQEKGVKTILTNGTTSEFFSLSLEERMALLEFCRKVFGDGVILNNVSACCLEDCVKLARHSEDYADALVVLPPFYLAGVPESGIVSFLSEVLSRTSLPIFLYHFPKHTQNAITVAMAEVLLGRHEHLVGIKDSEGVLENSVRFKRLNGGAFQVFVGGDRMVLEVLKRGLEGSITGGGNAFPELLLAIVEHFVRGDLVAAERVQGHLNVWSRFRKQHVLGEIALTKVALRSRLRGFPVGVRVPLVSGDKAELEVVERFVSREVMGFI